MIKEMLKRRDCDEHGLGSNPTRAILLCPRERYFTAFSFACQSWQVVLIIVFLFLLHHVKAQLQLFK